MRKCKGRPPAWQCRSQGALFDGHQPPRRRPDAAFEQAAAVEGQPALAAVVRQRAQQGAQGVGVLRRDHRQRRAVVARERPCLRAAAAGQRRGARRQSGAAQRRIHLGMQAGEQHRLAAPVQVFQRGRARRILEQALRQGLGGGAHPGIVRGLRQPRRACGDPLAQDRRLLLAFEHAPEAQLRIEAHALGRGRPAPASPSRALARGRCGGFRCARRRRRFQPARSARRRARPAPASARAACRRRAPAAPRRSSLPARRRVRATA